ncbi:hypothetical protein GGR56DRAFT_572790 [Xylariaceae sp. FL0804]|nr:hypothetical protein GGR56DRAFT_572790 [Xylariaceae sp. FL0804]
MAPPNPLPEYVYKIVPSAPPDPLPAEYPLSELDRKDGFIHLSTASQVPLTADLFFGSATALWVLKIRLSPRFRAATTWETPGCPHLRGGLNFGAADVAAAEPVRQFVRRTGSGERWVDAMARQQQQTGDDDGPWLV